MDLGQYFKDHFKEPNNQVFHIESNVWLIPCIAGYSQNEFKPLLRPHSFNNIEDFDTKNKQGWSTIEDEILLKITQSKRGKAWSAIAKELNACFYNGIPIRKGRQCRERWINHLDPNLKKGNWTETEDQFILNQRQFLGKSWSEISKKMQGRTENSVKNRFNSLLRKNEIKNNDDNLSLTMNDEQDAKIQVQSPNFNSLLLYSPQIINSNVYESIHDYINESPDSSPIQQFLRPNSNPIRLIPQRQLNKEQIIIVKEKLKKAIIDETVSDSL